MVTVPALVPATVTEHTSSMRLTMEHDSEEKETAPEPDSEKVMVTGEPMHSPQPIVPLQLMEFPTAMFVEPQLTLRGGGGPLQFELHGEGCTDATGVTKTPANVSKKTADSSRTVERWRIWFLNNKQLELGVTLRA